MQFRRGSTLRSRALCFSGAGMVLGYLTPRHLSSSLVIRTVLGLRWDADAPPVPGSTLMRHPETTSRSSRGAQSAVPGFALAGFQCLAEWPLLQHGVDSFAESQVREFVQGLVQGCSPIGKLINQSRSCSRL